MTTTDTVSREAGAAARPVYQLQGTLLEACSCGVLCPCWIGEDPDGGTCDAFVAYHFDKGEIDGVDVSGLNVVNIVHIPGNVLTPGSWQLVMFLDAAASERQRDAIVAAYSGKLGGPLADLAGLVGASRPKISIILSEFARQRLIYRDGRRLIVVPSELQNLAAGADL